MYLDYVHILKIGTNNFNGMVFIIKMEHNKASASSNLNKLFLFFSFLLLPCSASAACAQVDHASLLSLAFKPPLNWSSSTDCCSWEGVSCQQVDDDHRVVRLWLPWRRLSGVISPSITNLTHLTHLNLSHNSFSGPLPNDLFSSLSSLQVLDLSYNRLTNHLPVFSSKTTRLETLDLSRNLFNGSIVVPAAATATLTTFNVRKNNFAGSNPISFFCNNGSDRSSLTILDLSFNKFTGEIPPGLGACSKLQVFGAGFNHLSGYLPGEIFDLADLEELYLPGNRLLGHIGKGIVLLTKLKMLELSSNKFSGPIPSNIGKLSRLEKLFLSVNNFTGHLPPSLTNCTNLSTLVLRSNNLTGDVSAFNFTTLPRLIMLDLGNNNFTGELPQSLYSCKSLKAIRLAGNQLTGQISPEIVALKSLSFLSISINNLTNATGAIRILMGCKSLTTLVLTKNFLFEPVPDDESLAELDGFLNLRVLALGGCLFTGQVPSWLAKLKNLQALDLSYNLITGSVPSWLGSLPNLFYMDLSNNLFEGGFPTELCGMRALTSKETSDDSFLEFPLFVKPTNATNQLYKQLSHFRRAIYVGNNLLNGTIPIQIGQLRLLHELDLSHNNFTGSIPDQISNLTNLERLNFSYNHLSGAIPASLKSLNFMSFFSVAYNDLQGLVPSGGQFDTFTTSSFEGNPGLCGPTTVRLTCPPQLPPPPPVGGGSSFNGNLLTGIITAIGYGIGFGIGFWIEINKKKFLCNLKCVFKTCCSLVNQMTKRIQIFCTIDQQNSDSVN
ncbi:receptor-like protein 2 [Prunus avium]|uniref:Receptor-like protein 2 n=1 Tax=Prunus avium TaxID=42229 RepID=A0A6P5T079_PRUAV|nr:receptor-like protein 2 [Prunus avium]